MKKSVLIIVQNLPVPFDRRVWLEATTLQKDGYEVSVICPKKYGFNKSFEVLESINIFRYPLILEANKTPLAFLLEFISCFLFTFFLSVKVLYKIGFKIIHICNPPETYFPLAAFYKLFNKKIIFDHHDLSPEMYLAKDETATKDSFYFKLLLWMEKRTFKSADVIITTNESHKQVAINRGGKNDRDIIIVRSGPDIKRFEGYKYNEALKKGKKYLVCYLGEMCKQDGVGKFIEELNKYNNSYLRENVQFTFIGKGPEQPNLEELSKILNLDDYVNFTGRVSDLDLANYLTSADLCFDTSPYNDWTDKSTMNKIIEYMAFGKPIIAFDLIETKYSAQNASKYIKSNDYTAFFDEIIRLLKDKQERNKMGCFGKNRFSNELNWSNSVPNLLKAYQFVLSKY